MFDLELAALIVGKAERELLESAESRFGYAPRTRSRCVSRISRRSRLSRCPASRSFCSLGC